MELSEQLKPFFDKYGVALENYDAGAATGFYGYPCFMISDDFAGSLATSDELNMALTQAQEFYRQFDLTHVSYQIVKIEEVTGKLVRVRITWNYYDSKDSLIMDTDYVYLLRKEAGTFKIYVVIPFNEQQKLQELMQKKPS